MTFVSIITLYIEVHVLHCLRRTHANHDLYIVGAMLTIVHVLGLSTYLSLGCLDTHSIYEGFRRRQYPDIAAFTTE